MKAALNAWINNTKYFYELRTVAARLRLREHSVRVCASFIIQHRYGCDQQTQ